MAIVYQGIQQSLNRPVAIKVLKQQFSHDSIIVDYFNRESLIIARLIHPNIIHVIDRGLTEQGMPYFVMNFIEGTDTARLIMKGGLKFNRKLDIVIQTCKALAYAHKNGVIHRDVKPANILIDTEGNAVVTDFGIAQFYQSGKEIRKDGKRELLGTPSYMSPEQKINSNEVTFASDIYSLGVVMYELFTGSRFPKQLQRPSAIAPEIPDPLERIILKCLSPDLEKRPASVEAIKNQLFVLFKGAHIGAAQRKRALSGVPKMSDIFTILDIIKESSTVSVYLLRHNHSEQLMFAKTFTAMNNGIKTAKVLLSMKHDNIIDIQGVSGSDSNYIVVMEYLSGGSLADRMVMPHSWHEALRIIDGVCQGLFFAHNNRIAHGNLRPSNILFTDSERVKISDFGLGAASPNRSQHQQKQHTEMVQADILATGAVFYKMILGFGPVLKGDSFVPHKKFKILPDDIKRLVYRFLSQKPNIRFQSMKQVLDEINRIHEQGFELEETAITLDEDLSDSPPTKIAGGELPDVPDTPESRPRPVFLVCLLCILFFVLTGALLLLYDPDKLQSVVQYIMELLSMLSDLSVLHNKS